MNTVFRFLYVCSVVSAASLFTSSSVCAQPLPDWIAQEVEQLNQEDVMVPDGGVIPGSYGMHLYVNNRLVDVLEIPFSQKGSGAKRKLLPCLSEDSLRNAGIWLFKPSTFQSGERSCLDLDQLRYITYKADWEDRSLLLTVPQAYLDVQKLQQVEEGLWDDGIDNVFLNYAYSASSNANKREQYLNVRPGINFGAWRYRNYSVWHKDDVSQSWENLNNTLSRNIRSLHSELVLGDVYSSATVFDSIQFRGVMLQSSEQMRPVGERNYVPAVSGVASTDARVTIRQNGQVVYQSSVPAGHFTITDYSPASYGGNLHVTVQESDGSTNEFIVPFASVPILERNGGVKYSVSVGRYLEDSWDGTHHNVGQAELVYGLSDFTTLYGGTQVTNDYKAAALGIGLNLGQFGALSGGVKYARYDTRHEGTRSGRALVMDYAKGVTSTNTRFSFSLQQQLDKNYLNFKDAIAFDRPADQEKNRVGASIVQGLPDSLGALNADMVYQRFRSGRDIRSLSVGYTGTYKGINYGLYFRRYQDTGRERSALASAERGRNSSEVMFTVGIPLSRKGENSLRAGYTLSHNNDGVVDQSVRLDGDAYDKRLSWGVQQGYGTHGTANYGGVNAVYRGGFGEMNAAFSYARHNHSTVSYGMTGAVTASEYGVVFSHSLSESNAMVVAPDAEGIRVLNGVNVHTDTDGLAVVPGLSAYRNNTIRLDSRSLPLNVDVGRLSQTDLYPTKGALVLAEFQTTKGYKIMLLFGNQDIPSGARAYLEDELGQYFTVGAFNQLYMVSPTPAGKLAIFWPEGEAWQQCFVDFDVSNIETHNDIHLITVDCQSE
ncbi:fimbria/pilus outer membrane usher protein [Paenalcaligenes sp. Me131]|uniref:fimbria/pilus outer membrane usher protein n=1 Tax=Paenalcaligenes sp. Me131 TaxID=3392636 RepID=UPI003D280F95